LMVIPALARANSGTITWLTACGRRLRSVTPSLDRPPASLACLPSLPAVANSSTAHDLPRQPAGIRWS
jgi:hypothetical protein